MEIIGCDYTSQLVQTATNKDKAIRDLNFYIAKLGQDRIRRILALFCTDFLHIYTNNEYNNIPQLL